MILWMLLPSMGEEVSNCIFFHLYLFVRVLDPAGNLPYVATERGAMFYCDAKHQKKTLKLLLRNVGSPLRALLHVRRPEGGREGDHL